MTKKKTSNTPQHIQVTLRTILANLIEKTPRLEEMGRLISLDDIPEDMPFEAVVLDKLNWLVDHHMPAGEAEMLAALGVNAEQWPDFETRFQNLLQYRTEDRLIRPLAFAYWEWISQQENHQTWEEAMKIVNSPVGSAKTRTEKALALVMNLVQEADDRKAMTDTDRIEDWKRRQHERYLANQAGDALGPHFPFVEVCGGETITSEGHLLKSDGLIPRLFWGDVCMVSGLPGTGKSVLAWQLAEHNAWDLEHNVLMLHLEITEDECEMRQMTRCCNIPFAAQATGYFEPNHPKIAPRIQQFDDFIKSMDATIWSIFCPEWNITKIRTAMKLYAKLSERQGKKLVVIVDYLQKIPSADPQQKRNEALGDIAEMLKVGASADGSYVFLFSQESGDKDNSYSYGSREPLQKCQVYCKISRDDEKPEMDWPVMVWNGEKSVPARDAFGYVRYWHRMGDRHNARAFLDFQKANSGGSGKIEVWIENSGFRFCNKGG